MFQRKPRRFSRRSNYRGGSQHDSSNGHTRSKSNLFTNSQQRNNFRPSLSAEKMLEKYTLLAKDATTSGDVTLQENYMQHADHFMRVIEEKNQNQKKTDSVAKLVEDNQKTTEDTTTNDPKENTNIKK